MRFRALLLLQIFTYKAMFTVCLICNKYIFTSVLQSVNLGIYCTPQFQLSITYIYNLTYNKVLHEEMNYWWRRTRIWSLNKLHSPDRQKIWKINFVCINSLVEFPRADIVPLLRLLTCPMAGTIMAATSVTRWWNKKLPNFSLYSPKSS